MPGSPSRSSRARLASDSASADFWRQADEPREQQIAALLHAERAGNREGRAADRLAEAFEDQRIGPADRMAEQPQHEPHFARADDPADQAQQKLAATLPRSRYISCTAVSTASARVTSDDQSRFAEKRAATDDAKRIARPNRPRRCAR